MDTLSYRTVSANKATVNKEWVIVDAQNEVVGRLCARIALVLRGKHKPTYTPHVDCGDNVIVINAEKIRFTGNKLAKKEYVRYTGYPGGQRIVTADNLLRNKPIAVVEKGVKGMLPKNKLGAELFRNLHVYAGTEHPHESQQPKTINLNIIK
ncbi:MAG: 50S ribosomal protein L13 [Bacteroidales bacterium]|nr:50S ribosomal protein L13 [Bacteroidales bacterium]